MKLSVNVSFLEGGGQCNFEFCLGGGTQIFTKVYVLQFFSVLCMLSNMICG